MGTAPALTLLSPSVRTLPGRAEAHTALALGRLAPTGAFLSDPKRFTQSMKLDGELGRLMLEHGTMLGPPTEAERAEERTRKELARKVRFAQLCWARSSASTPAAARHSSFRLKKFTINYILNMSPRDSPPPTCPNLSPTVLEGKATVRPSRCGRPLEGLASSRHGAAGPAVLTVRAWP